MTIYSFCVNQHQFALGLQLRGVHSLSGSDQINVDLTPFIPLTLQPIFTTFVANCFRKRKMGMPVRIDADLYDQAKSHASAERRTIAGQIEFWALIGKAALDNPDLPIDFVKDLMVAKAEGRSLATPFVPQSKR